jgi:hypothetical protein
MPVRNLDALVAPRSIGIMTESFAPGEVVRQNAAMPRMAHGLGFAARACPDDPIACVDLPLGAAQAA